MIAQMKARHDAMTPEEKEAMARRKEEFDGAQNQRRATSVLEDGRPPRRHLVRKIDRSECVAWVETEKIITSRLGTGCLIALIGEYGSGKTQLAVEAMRNTAFSFRSCLYCTAVEFLLRVKATYKDFSQESELEVLMDHAKPRLLVIDEVGKRAETEWENRLLYELINRRYNDMKDTILITNQEGQRLEESIGKALVSRMNETGGIIECNWPTFRK